MPRQVRPLDDVDIVGVSFDSEVGFALIPNVGGVMRNFISLDHLIAPPLTSCLQLMGVSGCHSGGARHPSTEGLKPADSVESRPWFPRQKSSRSRLKCLL